VRGLPADSPGNRWIRHTNLYDCSDEILQRPSVVDCDDVSTFVLIHGGWHAAWCWVRVIPLLEKHGHTVIAPDLPGHGANATPACERPYELYVPELCALLDGLEERAILVGHSSGGMIITEAGRRMSKRVSGLVYLSAFLLAAGKTPRDVMKMDSESLLAESLEIDNTRGLSYVRKECAKRVFYDDCSDQDAAWAISQLQPEPLIRQGPPVSDTRSGEPPPVGTPRFFIECLHDRALSPVVQRWMYTESPCDAVYSLSTSHSPFLSAPAALAQHLLDIDQRIL
jgi:pimeloyl-ACP methyl ester carboxylesterase